MSKKTGAETKGPKDRLKRGIFLAPNLITSMGLMAGFFSICKSFDGDFQKAAWAIFVAGIFDGLDGRVARMTKTTSKFGVQYDSLSDLVSFGVAPSLLMYNFALRHSAYPGLGWGVALLFMVCGALRLARFNVQTATVDGRWFIGLSIPSAAGVVVFTSLFFMNLGFVTEAGTASAPNLLMALTLLAGLLMVSTVRYWAFKDIDFFRKHTAGTLVFAIIILAILFREPERSLFLLTILYMLSGPALWVLRRKSEKNGEPDLDDPDDETDEDEEG
jgi:CDP-diacylglycerol---serine O-phosphatidyltransferase